MRLYTLAKPPVRLLLQVVWRPRLVGVENLPRHGPVILASNHVSAADTYVMPALVPRPVTFLGKAGLFDGSWRARALGMLLRNLAVMPVDTSGGTRAEGAIRAGIAVLESGEVLGIYPEGTRSPDGRMYRGKTGAARMALAVGCPIVPVAMLGAFEARGRFLPALRPRITVVLGEPLDPSEIGSEGQGVRDSRRIRRVTDELMRRIGELSGQEYVDEYAADVKRRMRSDGKAASP
ncbi:MAG: lysophospholipid acyltransferase family protein [Brachybacterium sp.]|nr:lysophospholipid acyltransferase family protein [Brachybacterium sp.]